MKYAPGLICNQQLGLKLSYLGMVIGSQCQILDRETTDNCSHTCNYCILHVVAYLSSYHEKAISALHELA